MSGTFWFGWGCGVGGCVLGQATFTVWKIRWSRRSRAVRRRIAIMEYDLGYSDKPITEAQMYSAAARMWKA